MRRFDGKYIDICILNEYDELITLVSNIHELYINPKRVQYKHTYYQNNIIHYKFLLIDKYLPVDEIYEQNRKTLGIDFKNNVKIENLLHGILRAISM